MADGVEPPIFLVQWCEEHVIPLFCSAETSAQVIEYLRVYFNRCLPSAARATVC